MKTRPMKHQETGLRLLQEHPEYFALGAEQGTGKTWMLLADAEARFKRGEIDGALVLAPNGVHTNWVLREIPTHLEVPCVSAFWVSGGGKRQQRRIDKVMRTEPGEALAVLTMNIEAVGTAAGYDAAKDFLRNFRSVLIIDESQRIKNPTASRTKRVMTLAPLAASRRIASGTLIPNTPIDLFSQYEFLASGLLGTKSYRAFIAEYAELLPEHHALVRQIAARSRGARPQVIKRDAQGTPIFKNLTKLQRLMEPHTYRVLKKDCLDLPEKIYQTRYFDLSPAQMGRYRSVEEDLIFRREDGEIDQFTALTVITKLRQLTSGFMLIDGKPSSLVESEERLAALELALEEVEGPVIIWAAFREEIAQIAAMLESQGVVQFHGDIGAKDRQDAVDRFQRGEARFFIANPAAAGTGLTLTAAETAIYYSNSYSLEQRLQSEDRCHRIGTKRNVVYIDLVARGTIDERIALALQNKNLLASDILDSLGNKEQD
jgi:SNF2 family DNA or RNA helicase